MDATLLVLCGGQSRRMGRPKAWLKVGDTILLRLVAQRLSPSFSEVLLSFAGPEQIEETLPHPVVFDRLPSKGPLGGLEAGLAAARYDVLFAVACDMPFVTPATARHAVAMAGEGDAAIPRHDGRQEPVCAAYRKSALPAITAALDAGNLKMSELTAQLRVTWLDDVNADELKSLNTTEDVERFSLVE